MVCYCLVVDNDNGGFAMERSEAMLILNSFELFGGEFHNEDKRFRNSLNFVSLRLEDGIDANIYAWKSTHDRYSISSALYIHNKAENGNVSTKSYSRRESFNAQEAMMNMFELVKLAHTMEGEHEGTL